MARAPTVVPASYPREGFVDQLEVGRKDMATRRSTGEPRRDGPKMLWTEADPAHVDEVLEKYMLGS